MNGNELAGLAGSFSFERPTDVLCVPGQAAGAAGPACAGEGSANAACAAARRAIGTLNGEHDT